MNNYVYNARIKIRYEHGKVNLHYIKLKDDYLDDLNYSHRLRNFIFSLYIKVDIV